VPLSIYAILAPTIRADSTATFWGIAAVAYLNTLSLE
jgi:hypothetical protein